MKRLLKGAAALAVVVISLSATPAIAHPPKQAYESCKELNSIYKHGVGRKDAIDKVKRGNKRVLTWTKNTTVYRLNDSRVGTRAGVGQYDLDRDNDGIACEKR